jgi:hypothetical protein
MRVSWLTAPGRCEYVLENWHLNRGGFTKRTLYIARINGILHRQSFEHGVLRMPCACSLVVQCAARGGKGVSDGGYGVETEASTNALQEIHDGLSA